MNYVIQIQEANSLTQFQVTLTPLDFFHSLFPRSPTPQNALIRHFLYNNSFTVSSHQLQISCTINFLTKIVNLLYLII